MQNSEAQQTMSIRDFAKQENIGLTTAYEGARNGTIPVLRLGRRILVSMPAWRQMLLDAGSEK